jgi:hypothetical protein
MNKPRHLTKSRFKLATECPTKLFYTGKKEYANNKLDDSFLEALANGGFQVGELAKLYFLGGHDIFSLDYNEALSQTNELLTQEDVIIYEAAIRAENLFIRADILVKRGKRIQLIEVKAKSFDSSDEKPFIGRGNKLKSVWKPYLYDIAFQKYVVSQAFPKYNVEAFLMLADKSAECPTDGLNQKFKIITDPRGRKSVLVSESLNKEDLSQHILSKVNVDPICDLIYKGKDNKEEQALSFTERIKLYAEYYEKDEKIESLVSTACKDCEFCSDLDNEELKSGKKECWSKALRWTEDDFKCPTIFDVWDFRKKAELIDSGIIKISDIIEENISPEGDNKPGISKTERQWLQVEKIQKNDPSAWLDKENMIREFESWTYPLHFIDFETSMAAIPFNRGRHPYEGIAFQFSHHVVHEDGTIEHRGEFLNAKPGEFPNYYFTRALKKELEKDDGTIFMYSPHENTYLNHIYQQLHADDNAPDDLDDLCQFIRKITKSSSSSSKTWLGERHMVDMWQMVKRFYYDPATNGSNSIKQVLPAILNSSDFLKNKYSRAIYGTDGGIKSLNFKGWTWITFNEGAVVDPYKLLPKMFTDVSDNDFALISDDDEIKNGGAALTAYAKMQFEEMSPYERNEIEKALLKYCELDTMAMVMIDEGWKDMLDI